MLQVKDLTISMIKNGRKLISGLSFTLNRGNRTVIIGEEGNGKSTLLKLIFDPTLVEGYAEYSGQILCGNHRLGLLLQEIPPELRKLSVYEYLADCIGDHRTAAAFCTRLGLQTELPWSDRTVSTLSGGERVKLQLLRILLTEPDVLLLDEPTNDIDLETLEWLEGFINGFDGAVLFVSHDETLIENTADSVIHLEHIHHKKVCRHTVANVPYQEYIDARERGMAHQAQVARNELDEQRKKEERWREIYEKVEAAQRNISRGDPSGGRLLKKKMHSVKSMERRLERERAELTEAPVTELTMFCTLPEVKLPPRKEILRLRLPCLCVGSRVLARDIELDVNASEHIALIGRNGAGKTTLLRLISDILLQRTDIRCFYMPQTYDELLPMDGTPVDFLAPSGRKENVTAAQTYLGSVRYTADEMLSPIGSLSGGQRAKLLFVKMAMDGFDVLVLDEPTRNFSPLSTPVIRRMLASFGGCIISVTHDRKYLSEVCTRVYELTESGLCDTSRYGVR